MFGGLPGGYRASAGYSAIRAFAMGPARCALRPASSWKASKTPNVLFDRRRANQIGVVVSWRASVRPWARKSATTCSLPGLASRYNPR